ncbi:golgin family A protein [Perilla frutescens var. hirtella]|uniref:Golgin family A protein n=1 Tax=Perilla frutescens var. hirtella TaxID=608512 RepID=A0AAD4JEX7_PERFH|nr:golgin family A protein [Perilla frutescens var. hirtella]
MAGLLAWAADVVGGGGGGWSDDEADPSSIPLIFTPEQLTYVQQLDTKTASLNRSIQDLRLRLPPPDISQRLPHLHAHSLASNNDLALQLNAHSSTKQEAQQREARLREENDEYQHAISKYEIKIQEKLQEADLLRSKFKEMDLIEQNLIAELQRAKASMAASNSGESNGVLSEPKQTIEAPEDTNAAKSALMEKLDSKKKDLVTIEEIVQELEKKWQLVQDSALKHPTQAQREKALDKQLHSLIEQLAVKQAQAEGLFGEIHLKEMELEKLNGMWRRIESGSSDNNMARNRYGRSNSYNDSLSSEYSIDPRHKLPVHIGGRIESLQRLMLLRSAFVLYILVLHILVFIKLSF